MSPLRLMIGASAAPASCKGTRRASFDDTLGTVLGTYLGKLYKCAN